MDTNKAKLIHVLNQCHKNKSFNQLNLLLTSVNYLMADNTIVTNLIETDYNSIKATLSNGYDMICINFYHDNTIGLTLPYSGLFIVCNDSSNIQYDEIKSLLLKDSNQ